MARPADAIDSGVPDRSRSRSRARAGTAPAHPGRRALLVLNGIGGAAVLGSYAHGLLADPAARGALWGAVPDALRPLYTLNMGLAAAGYLAFSVFVLFRLDPARVRLPGGFGFGAFHVLYALILVPSALWMPLTLQMLASPSAALWWAIRLDLALVGIGSLGLLGALGAVDAPGAPVARRVAWIGCAFFCLQTAVLDALVWPWYFPV